MVYALRVLKFAVRRALTSTLDPFDIAALEGTDEGFGGRVQRRRIHSWVVLYRTCA